MVLKTCGLLFDVKEGKIIKYFPAKKFNEILNFIYYFKDTYLLLFK